VALIGLGQYKRAAGSLEKLSQAMVHAPAPLRSEVLGQAAQAWLLAGDPGRAYAADGAALALRPADGDLSVADLLVDRAEAAGSAGWYDKALGDLDRVLKADPARLDALIYRASAYRAQGRLDPALADVEKALNLAPDSAPALLERGNIRRLRGDIDGARQDWVRVAVLAPGSAARAPPRPISRASTPRATRPSGEDPPANAERPGLPERQVPVAPGLSAGLFLARRERREDRDAEHAGSLAYSIVAAVGLPPSRRAGRRIQRPGQSCRRCWCSPSPPLSIG
jgi:tetratricopeptide (TPR) repeat protein